jgi:hypothetical protein
MLRKTFFKTMTLLLLMGAGIMALASHAAAQAGCSPEDEELMEGYSQPLMQAIVDEDESLYLQLMEELEDNLSPSCRESLAQSQEAEEECSEEEKNLILACYQSIMEALSVGDAARYLELLRELELNLSPACQAALTQARQAQPYPSGSYQQPEPPPNVFDHGGGTFSVPGVGACGPGGCIPLD